jgi:hypothetical protein
MIAWRMSEHSFDHLQMALENEKEANLQKELAVKAKHEADSLKTLAQLREKKAVFDLDSTLRNAAMVVSPAKMNVLYIGVENPVDIAVSGVGPDKLVVKVSEGSELEEMKGHIGGYIVKCKAGTKFADISCLVKDGNRLIPIRGFFRCRVKPLPDPVAMISGFYNKTHFKVSELKSFKAISASVLNFDFEINIKILSFTVSANLGGDFRSEINKSNYFNDYQLKIITGAKHNDPFHISEQNLFQSDTILIENPNTGELIMKIKSTRKVIIEDIKVAMPDGTTRTLPPLILTIEKD